MYERRLSSNSNSSKSGFNTPLKSSPESVDSPFLPGISRYGRSHKPKIQDDYVSTDKKVSAYLKLSPGNQVQFFNSSKELKKKASPKKLDDPEGTPKRGRPPKTPKSNISATENVLKVAVKAEPQDPSSPVDGCEWMVGDLAWARVGGHPFWPCIIGLDPFQKIFTKIIRKGRGANSQRWLHVQFFGDNGRRSWLNSNAVMSYSGRDAFIQLGDTILAGMRRKDPKQTSAFVIKPAVVQVWEKAVQEAEDLVDSSREDRISFFATMFPPAPPPNLTRDQLIEKVLDQTELDSPLKKRGRKRKAEHSPTEEEIRKKQIKVEEIKPEPADTLLSSTPRTIADRKKRQALLIQLARSNQSPPSVSTTTSTTGPPTVTDTPKVTAKSETKVAAKSETKVTAKSETRVTAKSETRVTAKSETKVTSKSETRVTAKSETATPSRTSPTSKQTPLKRPATTESTVSTEKKKPKKKYVKKKVAADFQMFCSKHFDRVSDDHPELNQKEINKYLQKMWNEMDDAQKARYRLRFTGQEENESTEETSEDMEVSVEEAEEEVRSSKSSSPVPLATPMPKSSSSKRNVCKYLFSGAKSEKVCQICEKAGDTVRCRGPCQGYYHPDCITNPPIPQEPATPINSKNKKKKRSKKSLENSPASSEASQTEEQVENEANEVSSIVKRGRPKKIVEQSPALSEAELVENEATPSSLVKQRGRPKKSVGTAPTMQAASQIEEQVKDKDDSQLTKELEGTQKIEENGLVEEEVNEKKVPVVEVVEPEVVKGSAKVRKGSKDSESGEEGEGFRCKDCQEGRSQPCFVCHEYVDKKTGEAKLYRCITAYCGKVYHEECLKPWPQSSWRTNGNGKPGVMTCPQHTCHTCASDNPSVIKARYSNDKLVRCIRCPTTYHYGNYCLPAGAEILTNTQIICPQHYQPMRKGITQHVNAAWCFICASGGSLICCDLCPTAFHSDCLNISTPPDGSYVCEECLTGRFPLYGEIVWVKLGNYRWWPAEILYPALIPDNILNLPHVRGEFAVRFFGSHDHYWVHRGRVFLYQDGDTAGKSSYKKSSVDHMFERAVKEASEAQRKYLEEKATREAETRPGMKPPNYVKLKANRPMGNVRTMEMNLSSLTPCECDPATEAPCAPESDCLNRILMVECNPLVCPAGEKCCNQLFEKRQYPPLQPYHTQERGWGLKTLVPLKKGDFVIEYVGEMIDEEEYKKRLNHMHENNEENFYFLTIDKDRMLDAGPKGNVARFMNHSCQPNCETQKWTVNGDTRVGLFAMCDISANMELVFNYNLESIGSDKKPCMCGAPNCSGFIGVKANKNQDKEDSKDKKVVKKKKVVASKTHEEECFVCGEGGALLLCDGKHCTKGYHLSCLGKKQSPQGYWLCPWHQCNVCNKGRVRRCTFCVNSFCQEHSEGNISLDPVRGLLCNKHNQEDAKMNTDLTTTAESSTLMEIDEVSSENSTSASSQQSADSATKVEPINNNVVKPVNTPERRSRRSKSYNGGKPSMDTVAVNGAIAKVTKRGGRPSSVDEKLLGSLKKTEQNGKQSPTTDETVKNSTGLKNVEESLVEAVDPLPVTEASVLETVDEEAKNKGSERQPELKESDNRTLELILNKLEIKSELCDVKSKFENLNTEKMDCKISTNIDEKSSKDSKVEKIKENEDFKKSPDVEEKRSEDSETKEIKNDLGNSIKNKNEDLSEDSTIADDSNTPSDPKIAKADSPDDTEPLVTSCDKENDEHNKESKTEKNSSEHEEISKIDAVNQNGSLGLEVVTPVENKIVTNESIVENNKETIKTSEVFENNDNQNNDLKQSATEIKQDCNMEEVPQDKKTVNSAIEIKNEVSNVTEDSDRADEKPVNEKLTKEIENSDKACEDSNKKIVETKDKNKEVLNLDVSEEDDRIDDFELSYSECSNDKVYHSKTVCNAESSIEMKLTDCTSSENGMSKDIDKVNSKSDLANCIDQPSAMEVV